ncbi:RNA-binding motif protein, X-linked 2 [Vulpes lagopus]|uniref:RNA-binding motif protein, X-linked 2 n=1 Tax=Vulpes lagopus TaxID=494514 RepID=UPI001BC962FF|nr:RNA-binding motif protein, X-linked 2 [Vulpes lagopus]
MNPLTKVKLINELNEREVQLGVADKVSWHSEYKDSAWIFLGGLPYELTEGDIICVFSQYGEIVNINLVRDKKTGKSKGFCFLCYEDQRSTILAVDNFNGIKIKGRTIRVDHVSNYRAPKDSEEMDDVTKELQEKGCGAHTPSVSSSEGSEDDKPTKKYKKDKKEKKRRKKDKEKTDQEVQAEQPVSSSSPRNQMEKEKDDPGSKKHSTKNPERGQKSEPREVRKHHHSSPEVKTTCRSRAEDREREPRKEKPRHERRSSSRREEREEKNRDREREKDRERGRERDRDRDRGRSSDTHSSRHNGRSEGRSRRGRSRSQERSHRHKRARHSRDRDSSNPSDRRHH